MTSFLIIDYLWSETLDGLIQTIIFDWQQHYNDLDKGLNHLPNLLKAYLYQDTY